MRIERFEARTISEAVAKAKEALGADAVILQTNTSRRKGPFGLGGYDVAEVVATKDVQALDRSRRRNEARPLSAPTHAAQEKPAPAGERRDPSKVLPGPGHIDAAERIETRIYEVKRLIRELSHKQDCAGNPDVSPALMDFYNHLVAGAVPADLAKAMVRRLHADLSAEQLGNPATVRERLRLYISRLVGRCAPISLRRGETTRIAFVGPTGVGKTTTIAKLAAIFRLRQDRQVGLLTADTYRMAAIEQLRRYAELLNVPLRTVLTPADVSRALEAFRGFDLVLMDTAGRSHRDAERMDELKAFLQAAQPHETHLVVSVTSDTSHLMSVVRKFDGVRMDRIVFTKLDEAAHFGLILSAAAGLGKRLSYLTTGQEVPDDIEISRPDRIARLILGEEAA